MRTKVWSTHCGETWPLKRGIKADLYVLPCRGSLKIETREAYGNDLPLACGEEICRE